MSARHYSRATEAHYSITTPAPGWSSLRGAEMRTLPDGRVVALLVGTRIDELPECSCECSCEASWRR